MFPAFAKRILKKVAHDYTVIAADFSATRREAWEDFTLFLPYLRDGLKVLDVGCGNGRLFGFLREHNLSVSYTGIDITPPLLAEARRTYPDGKFFEGVLPGPLPLPDRSFDVVFAIAVLHHLPAPINDAACRELFRLLRPGGRAIVSVWNLFQHRFRTQRLQALFRAVTTFGIYGPRDLFIPWDKTGVQRYYYAFRPQELLERFEEAGFLPERSFFLHRGVEVEWEKASNFWIIARRA